jgi:membrane-associated phospholipid phosphatase
MFFRLVIFILATLTLSARAQVDSLRLDKDYLRNYWTDTRDLVTAPVRWKGKDWLTVAALAGTTVALTAIDQPVQDFTLRHQSKALSDISRYGLEPLGDEYLFSVMAGFLAHGALAGNTRSQATALLAAESFIISGAMVRISKYMTGRVRPDAWWEPGPGEWKGPGQGKSFYSGHTTSAFAVASVIAFQYRETRWVPATAYTLAALAGLSRVYDNRHWISDIFAGAVAGTVTGLFVCRQNRNRQFSWHPSFQPGFSGIQMTYRW